MCGRFVDPNLRETEVDFSHTKVRPIPRRYNIKPTQDALILSGEDLSPSYARWWLVPFWHKGGLKDWKATTFNARIEDAATKPSFRASWQDDRCLIPAGGYYEWIGPKGSKRPHFIYSASNQPTLWFAGLRSTWQDLETCTILTRPANADVSDVHHRMPVILSQTERDDWMAGNHDLTIGEGARLAHYEVSPFGIKDDGPDLIEPPARLL